MQPLLERPNICGNIRALLFFFRKCERGDGGGRKKCLEHVITTACEFEESTNIYRSGEFEGHGFKGLLHLGVKGYRHPTRHCCQDTNPLRRRSEAHSAAFAWSTKTGGVSVSAEIYSRNLNTTVEKIGRKLV